MKINWKVRFKNKAFWLALIPAVLVLIQSGAAVFGFTIDLTEMGMRLVAFVESAFVVLAIIGIITDHTTKGLSDSEQAMTYDKPKQ
jgi:phi LC3 family holin